MAQLLKSKKRALRPPFLITVATLAGAAIHGCGGAVRFDNTDPAGSGGSGSGTTGSSGTTETSGSMGGSGSRGSSGTTATTSVTSGSYTTGSSTFTVGSAGGATPGTGGGAPGGAGAAGAPPLICPADQPQNGTICATSGQTCSYPYCGDPSGAQATCVARRWTVRLVGTCNPPPVPLCPSYEPSPGSFCSDPAQTCAYPHTCCGPLAANTTYICSAYSWTRIEQDAGSCTAPPPSCPSIAPSEGQLCCFNAPMIGACYYGCFDNYDGGERFTPTAYCDGVRWHVDIGRCYMSFPVDAGPRDATYQTD